MINTADNLPAAAEQETDSSNPHHLPGEIYEKILLNLPLKSLVSFTSISTSWRSTIHSLIAAAEPRKLLVINDNPSHFDVWSACTAPLSAVSENLPLTAASELVCPFRAEAKLMAFCDEIWCVVDGNFLYLWNPSTGAYKELPDMSPDPRPLGTEVEVVYGLGYDPVDDDFKLLRIWRHGGGGGGRSSLYSLKTDSWKLTEDEVLGSLFPDCNGLFVNRALHWMAVIRHPTSKPVLVSFDFSTEAFRVLQQPAYRPELRLGRDAVDVAVLRGKLCVFLNYYRLSFEDSALVLWAMEDYGVVESWTKLYEIRYKSVPPTLLRPLYMYEDGRVVVWACGGYKESEIVVYKDRRVVARSKIVAPSRTRAIDPDEECGISNSVEGGFIDPDAGSSSGSVQSGFLDPGSSIRRVRGGFVHTESFVSPKKWELR